MQREEPQSAALTRAARSLRVRLTASYVLVFALVLTSIGLIFRQALAVALHMQDERLLEEEWTTLRGFLRVQDGELAWVFRPDEPDEAYAVEKLRRVLMLAESTGEILEISNGYTAIGPETKQQILRVRRSREPLTETRFDGRGEAYLVRMGFLRDEGKEYFVALGLPVEDTLRLPDRLILVYFLMMPVMLLAIGVLGWYATDRALRPLAEVTSAIQSVAGGNLSLRIPPRSTGDELDRLITTFNGMMERLELSFERMRRFSIDASHELRTPLTAIRGQLEVGLLTAQTAEHYRASIKAALEDVERLVGIVNGLLHLAEAESGQVRLQIAPRDLTPSLQRTLALYRPAAEAKHIQITVEPAAPAAALIDREQFDRLLDLLLSNAVKFTPEGGAIGIAIARRGAWTCLRISDNGPGISQTHLPHIFERFYRVREGSLAHARGAGLGLTLASWIAGAHGGRIDVQSEPGHGATFEVRLPAAPVQPQPTSSPTFQI